MSSQVLSFSKYGDFIIFMGICWVCSGMSNLFHSGEPRPGHSSPDVSHQCWTEGKEYLPQPAVNTFPRKLLAFFVMRVHHWLVLSLVSPLKVLLCRVAFQPVEPQCVPGVIHPRGQDFAFHFAELCETPLGPFLQPAWDPLNSSTTILFDSSGLCLIFKLGEGALCPSVQVTSDDINQHWFSISAWHTVHYKGKNCSWISCHWSQHFEPTSSARFHSTSVSSYLAYTWSSTLKKCYGRQHSHNLVLLKTK